MKLTVVTGYREYFGPLPVPAEELTRALRLLDPTAFVPRVRWTPEALRPGFLYPDTTAATVSGGEALAIADAEAVRAETERRVALYLEYALDAAPRGAHVMVPWPVEPFADPSARGATIAHAQARHLLSAARTLLGEAEVGWCRVVLGATTRAVLAALEAWRDGQGGGPLGTVTTAETLVIEPGAHASEGGLRLETLARNYSRAVMRLCEQIVRRRALLAGNDRAEIVSRLLEQNELLVRLDLEPERVLAALEPGGELFELLSRPLPPLPEPAPNGALSLRRPRDSTTP